MVNQTLISFKIDTKLLDRLNKICVDRNIKRNRFINDAVVELMIAYTCNMSTYQFRCHLFESFVPVLE